MKTDFLGRIRTRAQQRRVECWLDRRRGLFSQNDLDLANQAGASYRSDNNSALQALATLSSGATAPATTYAHQLWADTTSGTLKKRNAANSAWIILRTLDEAFLVDRSSNTILDESDIGKTFRATASFTQTLTAAATLTDGWHVGYRVEAGATITFDPNSSENIDGATTKVIEGPASGFIVCNGSAFYTVGFSKITLATEQPSTSVIVVDFTGIPSGVKRITIMFVGVSTNGTSEVVVQLGDSGGIENATYTGGQIDLPIGGAIGGNSNSSFFYVADPNSAGASLRGTVVLTLEDSANNRWVEAGTLVDNATATMHVSAGGKALSAVLDRVRITTANGSDQFDAGVINISYEC